MAWNLEAYIEWKNKRHWYDVRKVGSSVSEVHYYLNGDKIKTYECNNLTLYFGSENSKLVEIL